MKAQAVLAHGKSKEAPNFFKSELYLLGFVASQAEMPHNRDSGALNARQAPERQNNSKRRPNGVMDPHRRMIRLLQYKEKRHDDVADYKNGKVWSDIVRPKFANFYIARTAYRNGFQVTLKDMRFPATRAPFSETQYHWPKREALATSIFHRGCDNQYVAAPQQESVRGDNSSRCELSRE